MGSCGIYKILNTVNNKTYIGTSVDVFERKRKHFEKLRRGAHENILIQADFVYYKEEAFIFEVLEFCSQDKMYDLEVLYIKNAIESGLPLYNRTSGGIKNYKMADEAKVFMSLKNTRVRPVAQLDLEGHLLNTYRSASEASQITGCNLSCINKCCNGVALSSGGFQWCFTDDLDLSLEKKLRNPSLSRVVQLTLEGDYLNTFDSIADAVRALHKKSSFSGISKCCTGQIKSSLGYLWVYEEKYTQANVYELVQSIKKSKDCRDDKPVLHLNSDFSIISRYKTGSEASRSLGVSKTVVSSACRKRRPTKTGLNLLFESDYNEIMNNGGFNVG